MSVQQDQISESIKQKVKLLVSALEKVKQENELLLVQNSEFKKLLDEKEIAFNDLKEHYDRLKFAKSLQATNQEVHDAKIKVNRIVREIDNCIALLNR
ncbi:MAG: hypothetical protein AB9846_10440 [Tenuifilaceae bacterium]